MKKIFYLTLSLLILVGSQVTAQQTKQRMPGTDNYYWLHLPPGYNANSGETYPFILFLHGCGAVAFSNNCGNTKYEASPWDELDKVLREGVAREINNGSNMCFTVNGEEQCFIVISPQLDGNNWNQSIISNWLQYAMQTYNVDEERVYLTGLSLGGIGAYEFALSNSGSFYFNDHLAAVAPVAGMGRRYLACNFVEKDLPLWAFHGDQDNVVSFAADQGMINDINACVPGPYPPPVFTVFEGYGHNSYVWNTAYNTTNTYFRHNLYQWFLTNRDGANGNVIPNRVPVVDLGDDMTVAGSTVTLTSNAVDYDGSIAAYTWVQRSGPANASLSGANQANVSVSGMSVPGTYKFRLTVRDNRWATAYDEVLVTVTGGGGGNQSGNWLEMTLNNGAGKAVTMYYNSSKSNSQQQNVRSTGNNMLRFSLKNISGAINWDEVKLNLTVAYQTKTLMIGDYTNYVGSGWTNVTIPLADFGHDASKWQNGGVSAVSFKAKAGAGNGVFGVDEIKFIGGSQDFVWYGDSYAVSGEASSVNQAPNQFYVSSRLSNGGVNTTSTNSSTTNSLSEMKVKEEVALDNGDFVAVFDAYGNKLKEFTYEGASKDVKSLREYVNKEGLFIYKVLKSDGAAHTVKIMQK